MGAQNFVTSYMGEYVNCLMTHGELPALGVSEEELKSNQDTGYVCASQFQFTLAEGFTQRQSSQSGSGSGANSSGRRSSQNRASSSNAAEVGATSGASETDVAARERARRRGGQSSSDLSSAGGGGGGGSTSAMSTRLRRTTAPATADGGESEVASGGSSSRVVGELGPSGYDNASGRGRSRYRAITGQMQELVEKNSKGAATPATGRTISSQIIADDGRAQARKRSQISVDQFQPKKPAPESDPDPKFNVGTLIKWAIIILIGIALLILVGGQILNYSNSDGS